MWVGEVGVRVVGRRSTKPPTKNQSSRRVGEGWVAVPAVLWDAAQEPNWDDDLREWVWVDPTSAAFYLQEGRSLAAILAGFLGEEV